ncbi:MAG: FtsK/SpoIIIE domain-containing protein [Actinomycetota bacterium]
MADPIRPAAPAVADVLMRRLVNLMSRLNAVCAEDAAELARLREKRQVDVAAAERSTRAHTEQAIAAAHDLASSKSLGGRLRAELATAVEVVHQDPGNAPASLDEAIAEWARIAPAAERRVREFRQAHEAWQQRLLKRAKSAPTVDSALWRDLDRLDLIHRSLPALTQSLIAGEIQAASGAADVVLAAEEQRQQAGQAHLAEELKGVLADVERELSRPAARWSDPRWDAPAPAASVERLIRLGELIGDLPPALGVEAVPALVEFPLKTGIAVRSSVAARPEAFGLLKAIMLRLLAAVPPGSLQLKVIDPVALGQSVAEFRHLAEYDERLVDEKTWTSERDIERLLDGLTDHIEVVISQYLKGQFETIDEYNEHAGEVAQPYRALVVFDFPHGFSDRAARQLISLSENGPRCGVYTVLHYSDDAAAGVRSEVSADRIARDMHRITLGEDGWQLDLPDPVGHVGLRLFPDQAPPIVFDEAGQPETGCARLLAAVGATARAGHERPTAVTLSSLLPVLQRTRMGVLPDFNGSHTNFSSDPATWWRASTAASAVAPLGRSGAQQVASLHFSSTDIAGGAIMVGLPRSGKTTSLHAVIMTMAMLYSPEELELYLVDAKHGVEFKTYEHLPHARMVSIHSDREFSLAILKSLDAEIRRRAEVMKAEGSGRANITEFRAATGERLSRIVLIMDEFHELFEEPDRIGQEAFAAFSNIVRMGPFSGVHVVVASQTLSSMPAMDRPTLMLLPQRVAFTCTEYDAEILMGATNHAALRLSKTGEGLFNPARGEESRNQLFQGLHIPSDERTALLKELADKARQTGWTRLPRVFDGDAVVDRPPPAIAAGAVAGKKLTIDMGEPFSLEDTEKVAVRRTRGGNLLLLGNEMGSGDRALLGALHSCLLAARGQGLPTTVIDFAGDDDDDDIGSPLVDVVEALPATYVRSVGASAQLAEVSERVAARTASADYKSPSELVVIVGLERARVLQPVDPYAIDDGPSDSSALLAVLQGGPEVGIHTVLQADRARTLEARLGPDAMAEFGLRVGGSCTDQADLSAICGQYGDVPPLRHGQLLLSDLTRGTARRLRGFAAVRDVQALAGRTGDE